jgi:putative oxidoreductase
LEEFTANVFFHIKFFKVKRATVLLEVICYAFILLFLYTAFSKWFQFDIYVYDLNRSKFLQSVAPLLSVTVPGLEMIAAILLFVHKTRNIGLYLSLFLMLCFTIYVGYIVLFFTSADWPCTCGGIIRELSWPGHLVFNLVWTFLALIGIILQRRLERHELTTNHENAILG